MGNTQTSTTVVPNQGMGSVPALLNSFAPLGLILLAFYFLMIRPQKKHEAKKREMLANLKKGDQVVTASGLMGEVHKIISDEEISLEISEGVNVRFLKSAVVRLLDKNALPKKEQQLSSFSNTKTKAKNKK